MAVAGWLKFNVRSLMLIVLVVAVLLAWQVNRARRQRRGVDAIKAYGGHGSYDWQYVRGTFTPGRSPWAQEASGLAAGFSTRRQPPRPLLSLRDPDAMRPGHPRSSGQARPAGRV